MTTKKIYDGYVVYEFTFYKNKLFRGIIEYSGSIKVPFPKLILAFSEKNAKDIIVYSNLWNKKIADEIMWRDHKVKEYDVHNKYVEIFEIDPNEYQLIELVDFMRPQDFKEWFFQSDD